MYAIEQNKSLYFTISHIENVIYLYLSENYSSFPQIMEENNKIFLKEASIAKLFHFPITNTLSNFWITQ